MPKAEVGTNKYLANKMKSKGLQRLRWYCQACEKQCRDSNGFKCHTTSESHIRQMQLIGEDPKKFIQGFSNDFQRDFLTLLRVAHGEKFISANRFYNEYIRDKEHIHMNSTKWSSLTEFVKHLGREGIVSVKEDEKDGLMIAWRDTSIQAVRRREEIRAQELADARNGAGEDRIIKRMAQRAKEEAEAKAKAAEARNAAQKPAEASTTAQKPSEASTTTQNVAEPLPAEANAPDAPRTAENGLDTPKNDVEVPKPEAAPVKFSFGLKPKVAPLGKTGLGQTKSQSVFKRARAENREEKLAKKLKV